MRIDVAKILVSMGFSPLTDFRAYETSPSNVDVKWLSQLPQPSSADIDAAAANADVNLKTIAKTSAKDLLNAGTQQATMNRAMIGAFADAITTAKPVTFDQMVAAIQAKIDLDAKAGQ